jgi:hypothetical protein
MARRKPSARPMPGLDLIKNVDVVSLIGASSVGGKRGDGLRSRNRVHMVCDPDSPNDGLRRPRGNFDRLGLPDREPGDLPPWA